jgi:dUTP pyrophosphatase
MLRVPLHRLDPELGMPTYARPGDAGADLMASRDVVLAARGGRAGLVLPRSGLALRHGVTCLNAPGLIDAGYRGELQVLLVNHDPVDDYAVSRGDRIAQLVIVRVEEAMFDPVPAEGLGEATRGAGGFGHTGT